MNVASLWQQLEKLEHQNRFAGASYPSGLISFPFRLSGQGFFPAGDGLWHDNVSASSSGELPTGGILFLNADSGTLDSYNEHSNRGYQKTAAWKNLRRRVVDAGLPTSKIFCSNIYLGLRARNTALGVYPAVHDPGFPLFCAELFRFQLEALAPRLIVALGPVPQVFLHQFDRMMTLRDGSRPFILYTPRLEEEATLAPIRRQQLAIELREAWENTQPVPYHARTISGIHQVHAT